MDGKVYYRPSNGTEGEMFFAQCNGCKHDRDNGGNMDICAKGIGTQMLQQKFDGYGEQDNPVNWFDPADLKPECPATCLRRVPIDAIPDVRGQMPMFDAELPVR
jgi:hypothetical protein